MRIADVVREPPSHYGVKFSLVEKIVRQWPEDRIKAEYEILFKKAANG
jgi:hypothetical protein